MQLRSVSFEKMTRLPLIILSMSAVTAFGQPVWAIPGKTHGGSIRSFVYSPQGQQFAYSFDDCVNICNTANGRLLMTLTAVDGVGTLSWQDDGVYLGARTGGPLGAVIWHMPDGGVYTIQGSFSGDNSHFLVHNNWYYTESGAWTIDGNNRVRTFSGVTGGGAFSPNGRYISWNESGTTIAYVDDFQNARSHWNSYLDISFFTDPARIFCVTKWGVQELTSHTVGPGQQFEDSFLAGVKQDSSEYYILKNEPGQTYTTVDVWEDEPFGSVKKFTFGAPQKPYKAAVGGPSLALVSGESTLLFNLSTHFIDLDVPIGPHAEVLDIAVSPSGTTAAAFSYTSNELFQFNPANGTPTRRVSIPNGVNGAAIDPLGRFIVYLGINQLSEVVDATTLAHVADLPGVAVGSFTQDGGYLVTNKGRFAVPSWNRVADWSWPGDPTVFSTNNLALSRYSNVVYSTLTGDPIGTLVSKTGRPLTNFAASLDGRFFAAIEDGNKVVLFSGATRQELRRSNLTFPYEPNNGLQFSADGRFLAVPWRLPQQGPSISSRSYRTFATGKLREVGNMDRLNAGGGVFCMAPLPGTSDFLVGRRDGALLRMKNKLPVLGR